MSSLPVAYCDRCRSFNHLIPESAIAVKAALLPIVRVALLDLLQEAFDSCGFLQFRRPMSM